MIKNNPLVPSVAFIVLDGDVKLYVESLRYIAWKLRASGTHILRFGCAGYLNACTSLNAANKERLVSHGKSAICARCRSAQASVLSEAVFEVSSGDLIETRAETEFLAKLRARLEESQQIDPVLDMTYDGFEVARIAFFDFSISMKLSHTSKLAEPAARERFVLGVKDQLILLRALQTLNSANKITHVIYVNGNYSQNTLVRLFFTSQGVKCISIEPQLTSQAALSKVLLVENRLELKQESLLSIADVVNDKPVSKDSIRDVLQNFGARIYGYDFNAYTSLNHDVSTINELKSLNNFLCNYSRNHAFFLSSEDELTPHILTHGACNGGDLKSPGGYKSQADFVCFLLEEARRHPELGFVIRLHPRMSANKRDYFESEEHLKYKQIFTDKSIPENVFALYGDSKISSYFIISKVDLVIVAWSTIGLEALLLGKPVV